MKMNQRHAAIFLLVKQSFSPSWDENFVTSKEERLRDKLGVPET